MAHGRDQIAKVECGLSFRFDLNTLMVTGVTLRNHGCDPGQQFGIAVQQFPTVEVFNGREVVPPITRSRPFIGSSGILIFTALNGIPSLREGRAQCAAPVCYRIATGMIEM